MFVDRVIIEALAGDGGNGCISFRREKFIPRGGPDGGDGGKGGDIILDVDPNTNNLLAYKYQPILRGKRGQHGMGSNCFGRAGKDMVFKVPVGTVIYRLPDATPLPAALEEDDFQDQETPSPRSRSSGPDPIRDQLPVVADLTQPGPFILCRGGKGGKGNTRFKSSTNRAPRIRQEGRPGEIGRFLLELKTIADVGLVGYPNAGKSTLLSKLSAATPKIAPYPFTTLAPQVGVVELPKYQRFTIADIPGLIEGAHLGVGLGHDFLRHIERCRVLLHVLDMAGSEARDPLDDFRQLRTELKLFRDDLSRRPFLIAANKMDLPGAEENLARFKQHFRRRVVPISAATGEGLDALVKVLRPLVAT
jgi:GTP-binding protein